MATDRELLDYLLGDNTTGMRPTIRDLCYTAFMRGRTGKNPDDGGPCDWFTDTLPLVDDHIAKLKQERDGLSR